MATYPARSTGDQTVNYLRAPVTFAIGTAGIVQVGTLPAGALVLRAYVVVTTVFNFGTNNLVKVGIVGSDASILSTVSLTAAGVIAATSVLTTAAAASTAPSVDTQIIATTLCTGTAGTAGQAYVVVEYAPVA
jgi:hypothetical protein